MFDFKFDWEKNLETGIESIDTQHKQLFKIGRDIEQLLQIQCIGITDKQLIDIVCELRDFTGYHFYAEESMMAEMGYDGMNDHIKYHRMCSDYITKINMPKLKADPLQGLELIRDEVQSWIMMHILGEDKKMTQEYLAYQKAKTSKAAPGKDIMEDKFGSYIAMLDVTKFYLYKDQTCRGRMVAVFNESAKELCALSALERNMFFADIAKAAKAVKKSFKPDAMCYQDMEDMNDKLIFHIIPKYKENGTYGVPQTIDHPVVYTDDETYQQILEQMQKALK